MKRCEMGKTYIKLNDERESYEEIQKFFEEWGLEKVSEESLGDELFHRVITYKGNGIECGLPEELGCKYYGRYMDDFYLLSDDKEYLKNCLCKIKEYLADLKLTLNDKTEIVPMKKGIRFLGFHTYITDNGKVIRKLNGDNKRAIKKRLRKYAKLVKEGRMTRDYFNESYNSWKNHASHGNCYKLICSMDEFVESLFCEDGKKENNNQSK